MNHFVLPGRANRDQMEFRYGLYAMELLINALLKAGAQKQRLVAKIFGGAMMHDGLGQIGEANGSFALDYLRSEGIRCISSSLGGVRARKIRFTPATGKAQQMLLQQEDMPPIARRMPPRPDREVELF
ncbi:chemotaxis protein CheD [Flavimaricola sp.]|nr:chemotaxis protein CheD [Flavimaricola sp.]MDA9020167.1 chemotaxis protein CheD [Flavimaricola sp.]